MTTVLLILFSALALPPAPIEAPRPSVRWLREVERRPWRSRR